MSATPTFWGVVGLAFFNFPKFLLIFWSKNRFSLSLWVNLLNKKIPWLASSLAHRTSKISLPEACCTSKSPYQHPLPEYEHRIDRFLRSCVIFHVSWREIAQNHSKWGFYACIQSFHPKFFYIKMCWGISLMIAHT